MGVARIIGAGLLAATAALAAAGSAGAQEATSPLRDVRYCEIIPSVQQGDTVTTYVYNTLGWNDCPQDLWSQLTEQQVNQEYGSQSAKLNGPRHWVIDGIEGSGATAAGDTFTFGGIKMSLRAKLTTAAGEATVGEKFYVPNQVQRETVFSFDKGKLIYKLTDPDGHVYVMQSYAQIVAPNLSIDRLRHLGPPLLRLPDGWSYSTRRLRHPMTLTASGLAYVVNDNLANSYQRMNKPSVKLSGVPSRCASAGFKVKVKVGGDTALTRVTAGGKLLARTTDAAKTVTVPKSALGGNQVRIVAASRNDAGRDRATATVPVC